MEKKRRIAMKNKKKRNMSQENVLPLLLAASCSKSHVDTALIKKCLNNIFVSLPRFHLPPILALLPSLLESDCAGIVCRSAEIVGAASLASFEMSGQIAAEDEIVKKLISLFRNPEREIAIAACNAVLDLSAASIGRQRLLEFGATENFIYWHACLKHISLCFMQEFKPPATTVRLAADMMQLNEDEYLILLLQGATALINSSTIEQLQLIPKDVSEIFLVLLKGLWGQAHKQRLQNSSSSTDQGNGVFVSSISTYNLVESIFRLSINYDLHPESIELELVEKGIFGLAKDSVKPFLSEIWEISPMLIRNASKASLSQDGIFNPFLQYHGLKEAIPCVLPSMLQCFTSCPAIASDELDILHVIEDIKSHLGYPVIYNQDLRVVKTQFRETEVHYFQEHSNSGCSLPHILSINDMLECEEAFKEGYSIALRGMEFRYQTIAAVADGLASLFGQPSAGVNMYLTPSNSQGLARHSDDHCVFVCQLMGMKRWKVFPRPDSQLPRLYEPCSCLHELVGESNETHGYQQIVLKEGDVLYLPRGSPHEAITDADDDDENANTTKFSLHMTLAIEIEPPFEWEGFMHVALYCWDKKQRKLQYESEDSVRWHLHLLSVRLLHIAIRLIGNLDPAFHKASLVGAMPFSSDTRDWLHKNQRKTFSNLMSRITSEFKFSDAASHLEAALQKDEDPFEPLSWMKHLAVEGEEIERPTAPSADSRYILDLLVQHRDIAEAAFVQVWSMFCDEVEFRDLELHYKMLLDKYRKVRKQYTNGMLSLHSALRNKPEFSSS